jgi:NADPH:quinone reductase-like Zn-dependent oxidoreductase
MLRGHGGPDQLEVSDNAPEPTPARGEVLIHVGAAGINNTDIWAREGAYGTSTDGAAVAGWQRSPLRFPRIQGADVVGRIVDVGQAVSRDRVSQRVIVDPEMRDDDGRCVALLGSERDGGFAEYLTVPASNAFPIDSELTDAELATFPIAWITAHRMLSKVPCVAGDHMLVTGASGGVGTALIQLGALKGLEIVAVVSTGKDAAVLDLGARAAVLRDEPDPVTQLRTVLGGTQLDIVADVVGGPLFGSWLSELRPEGSCVVAGAIVDPMVCIDLRTVYLREIAIVGSTGGLRADFEAIVALIESKAIRPVLADTYRFSDVHAAQDRFRRKDFVGSLVLLP